MEGQYHLQFSCAKFDMSGSSLDLDTRRRQSPSSLRAFPVDSIKVSTTRECWIL